MSRKINLLYYWNSDNLEKWSEIFKQKAPNINLVNEDNCDPNEVDVALVWLPPEGFLKKFKNLKGVINLGQGVDHLLKPGIVPEKLPIIRLVDNDMSKQMSAWVSLQVLRETRFLEEYKKFEKEKKWQAVDFIPSNRWNIGVLGIGAIGKHVALSLSNFGYNVKGWSRSKKNIDGIKCYYGESGLHKILVDSKILICILPLTPETKHIISKKTMSYLPDGSTIINAGRGGHINESDLLDMIDNGKIKNAYLDVFETEPLPSDHIFWRHKKINVWPHIAAETNTETSINQIIDATNCLMNNIKPANQIDRNKGY